MLLHQIIMISSKQPYKYCLKQTKKKTWKQGFVVSIHLESAFFLNSCLSWTVAKSFSFWSVNRPDKHVEYFSNGWKFLSFYPRVWSKCSAGRTNVCSLIRRRFTHTHTYIVYKYIQMQNKHPTQENSLDKTLWMSQNDEKLLEKKRQWQSNNLKVPQLMAGKTG